MRFRPYFVILLALFVCAGSSHAAAKGQAAFLKSLVIPGWGQYELNRPRHALAFFAADLLLVGSALGLRSYGTAMQNDYQAFAAAHAGVIGDHEKNFYADVGNWMTVYDYNDQRMADREYASLYDTQSEFWSWDSDNNRASMDEMRLKSERALNRVVYAVALVGVNHLVSAFHAGRLSKASRDQASDARFEHRRKVDLAVQPTGGYELIGLSLSANW